MTLKFVFFENFNNMESAHVIKNSKRKFYIFVFFKKIF